MARVLIHAIPEQSRMHAALMYIRQQLGHVCDEYEICQHESCADSYSAWAVADMILRQPVTKHEKELFATIDWAEGAIDE